MFNFYLAASYTVETLGDKLALGGKVALLGMGTVFAVLAILWGLVELLHLLLTGIGGKKKLEAPAASAEAAPAPVEAAPAPANDLEIVAVITAAIAAASGASPSSFRVVSFKRANDRFSSGK